MNPEQAALVSALQAQHEELSVLLDRLERARRELLPPPPESWVGAARHAYDAALDGLVLTVEVGVGAVRLARHHTAIALSWMHRG